LDGPAVVPPVRQGFGSVLLEQAAAQDFETKPKFTFARAGVIYELDAPLKAMVSAKA
jgi:hypothetical protein